MPTELYLDTARLGRMALVARQTAADFARLTSDEGGSACVEELLRRGAAGWPEALRRRYPGLADWQGVARLKCSLRSLAGAPAEADVYLACRSGALMRLAARALFRSCRRVLHTDLEWPGYLALLEAERGRARGVLACTPVRDAAFRDGLPAEGLAALVADHYRRHGCDGLFLSAVSYDGLRFPLPELARALAFARPARFVVIDGAQALGHLPCDLGMADAYLAGGHKWLRSGHPLGVAIVPRPGSRGLLRTIAREMVGAGELDDPLLGLSRQLEGEALEPFGETADPAGLLCGAAAVAAALDGPDPLDGRFRTRVANAEALRAAVRNTGWRPLTPAPPLFSGILLLQAEGKEARSAPPEALRAEFQRRGIALTAYPDGIIRISAPSVPWEDEDLDQVRRALRRCS
jgi:hypothetical protein